MRPSFLRRRGVTPDERPDGTGPRTVEPRPVEVQFVGLQPLSPNNLYEFMLAGGGSPQEALVHLHDGACRSIVHELLAARLTLDFAFEPEWAPAGHPEGCVVRMEFDEAAITSWRHEDGPAAYAGQCSGLDRWAGTVFTLELLNDIVVFSAHRVTVRVLSPAPRG